MKNKRVVVFTYNKSWNNDIEEEFEYDLDTPDEEITKDFEEWVWNMIGDQFSWDDKE